ncbi:MAG: hypothetical protein LAP13_03065 [Acidobacteriia bacterium]|nr:hypothetical protein [Terriglobia bacterium]
MAEYEFRLRFNLANAYRIGSDAEELELLCVPTGERFRLRTAVSGMPIKDHARAAILAGPYASCDEARAAAERAKVALLYWAVEQRLGIDFGDGRQRSIATEAGMALLREQLGCPIRNDVHGIDVYERVENLKFVAVSANLEVGKNPTNLVQTFAREFLGARHLTEKQVLASEIYSASFFDVSPRSRFITLVTAVEALLDPAPRPESVQTLVTEMEVLTRTSGVDDSTKEAIVSSLQWLREESIGRSGRAMARRLLPHQRYNGRSSWAFFTQCYHLRSQIVHQGTVGDPSIDMLSLANTMETFVSELLLASLRD